MQSINELCDLVRQTAHEIHGSYRFQIRKYAFNQGRVKEEGLRYCAGLMTLLLRSLRSFAANGT